MKRFFLPCIAITAIACNDTTSPTSPGIPASPDLGSMQVGDVRVLTFAEASNGLTIPANLASAQYAVVAANVAHNTDIIPQYTVSGDRQVAGVPTLSAALLPPSTSPGTRVGGTRGVAIEGVIRHYERSQLSPRLAQGGGCFDTPATEPAALTIIAVAHPDRWDTAQYQDAHPRRV